MTITQRMRHTDAKDEVNLCRKRMDGLEKERGSLLSRWVDDV